MRLAVTQLPLDAEVRILQHPPSFQKKIESSHSSMVERSVDNRENLVRS